MEKRPAWLVVAPGLKGSTMDYEKVDENEELLMYYVAVIEGWLLSRRNATLVLRAKNNPYGTKIYIPAIDGPDKLKPKDKGTNP